MQLSLRHVTTYAYDPPVSRFALRLKLYPSQIDSQSVKSWKVSVNGVEAPSMLTTGYGDRESIWSSSTATDRVEIVAEGLVETQDVAGFVRGLREMSRPAVFLRETPLTAPDAAIVALAGQACGTTTLEIMHALCGAVRDAIDYTPGSTGMATTAAQAIRSAAGVCQDHAHVFVSAARVLGVPARYVVGYLLAADQQRTETHAWAEAFVPELGWVGFDPANRLCPTDRYVRLASGLDSVDAAPVRGNFSGQGFETLTASVDITQRQSQSQRQQQ
ncbi:MAG: transglutaminase family protein [Alphaproteobacteria bacterium]|nr:transglutaminase family protein [Alphaproteobacteria bacterium]